jgi:hypothetical protein
VTLNKSTGAYCSTLLWNDSDIVSHWAEIEVNNGELWIADPYGNGFWKMTWDDFYETFRGQGLLVIPPPSRFQFE